MKSMEIWLDKYKENPPYCGAPSLIHTLSWRPLHQEKKPRKRGKKQPAPLNWTQSPSTEKKSLFAFKTQPLQTISPQSSEITAYLTELTLEETNYTLQFQKTAEAQFHALSKLARKYLALAASSAPVEQVFSILGKILYPERARMSDHAFEMQMFLKCNGHL